jgi:hypothetical protein
MKIYKESVTQKNVIDLEKIPDLRKASTKYSGPELTKLQHKFYRIYTSLVIIGILPAILNLIGFRIPTKMIACFLGLLIPGGGFMASGNLVGILIGVWIEYYTFTASFMRNTKTGDKSWIVIGWIIGILGGLLATGSYELYEAIPTILGTVVAALHFARDDKKYQERQDELRVSREKRQDTIQDTWNAIQKNSRPLQAELTEEQLRAARIIFDITTQEIGDFTGIDLPKWSSNEFRYQMCYAGYGLLMMQKRYVPNFRGYMQHSLRYIIESFTSPEACEYWNVETLGGHGSLDFDPISPRHHDNIMLKGWIAPIICGYHAVTGDDRYNQKNALKFKPFKKHLEKTYDYSVDDIVKVLVEDWKWNPLTLIPCEPHLVFPVCNTYPMIGVQIYDNDFETNYAQTVYSKYVKAIREEFTEKSGSISIRKNSLFGLNWYPARNFDEKFDFTVLPMMNALYPGLARRNYVYLRQEVLEIAENGEALFGKKHFNEVFDFSSSLAKGGLILGATEQCAAEFGDWEMYDALEKAEKMYLPVTKNPKKLEYATMNFVNGISMAVAKWAQVGDWYYLTHSKAPKCQVHGPVLDECRYPDILVAKAVSTGEDLELVLYNGTDGGQQTLHFAQMEPETRYVDEEHPDTVIKTDREGKGICEILLEGRYHMHLVKTA